VSPFSVVVDPVVPSDDAHHLDMWMFCRVDVLTMSVEIAAEQKKSFDREETVGVARRMVLGIV
jgi:hypothetical protein